MNTYGALAYMLVIIICAHVFGAVEPISRFIENITQVPPLNDSGTNPALYNLAVRLAYLIVFVAVVKLLFGRRENDE